MRLDKQRVRDAIRQRGITRTEIAARAGLSTHFIAEIMQGHPVGRLSAISLARSLRRPLGSLMSDQAADDPRRSVPAEGGAETTNTTTNDSEGPRRVIVG